VNDTENISLAISFDSSTTNTPIEQSPESSPDLSEVKGKNVNQKANTKKVTNISLKSRFMELEYLGFFDKFDSSYSKTTCNNDVFIYITDDSNDLIRGPVPIEYVRELMKFKKRVVRYHPGLHWPMQYYDSSEHDEEIYLVYKNSKYSINVFK
jgi:hypothetical protein